MPRQWHKTAPEISKSSKLVAVFLASAAAVLGIFQACGWIFKRPEFLTLWPGQATMSLHTSVSILLGAIGVGVLLFRRSAKLAFPLGFLLLFLGLSSFAQTMFGIGFSLNDLIKASVQEFNLPAITSLYTSIAFILLSIAVIIHVMPVKRTIPTQSGIIGIAATAIGFAAFISYLLNIIPDSSSSSALGSLAFPTAIGISLLGTALVIIEIKRYAPADYSWGPAMIGTLAFVITLIMSQALDAVGDVGGIFPYLFLCCGILLAGLASISAYSALIARRNLNLAREKQKELGELNARLEAKVRERTQDLANSNAELERFSSLAAHDLKSPINSMTQFAELLEEELGDRLSEEEKEYLTFISKAGERARNMVDSLLQFAKSGNRSSHFEILDVNHIAKEAGENLYSDSMASRAEIAIQTLPTICGDRIQLTQLFQNLLANAIKFRRLGQHPKISVSAHEDGSSWHFSVADNGIGFDPAKAAKVFEIFSRLHSDDEYPGTGLGLAMCRRIVENHNGRIWVDSEPGHGTTFHFTLPKVGEVGSQCAP